MNKCNGCGNEVTEELEAVQVAWKPLKEERRYRAGIYAKLCKGCTTSINQIHNNVAEAEEKVRELKMEINVCTSDARAFKNKENSDKYGYDLEGIPTTEEKWQEVRDNIDEIRSLDQYDTSRVIGALEYIKENTDIRETAESWEHMMMILEEYEVFEGIYSDDDDDDEEE